MCILSEQIVWLCELYSIQLWKSYSHGWAVLLSALYSTTVSFLEQGVNAAASRGVAYGPCLCSLCVGQAGWRPVQNTKLMFNQLSTSQLPVASHCSQSILVPTVFLNLSIYLFFGAIT